MPCPHVRRALAGLRVALAVGLLHLALALYYWAPEPDAATLVAPTWELFGVLAAIGLVAWRAPAPRRRRLALGAIVVLVLAAVVVGLGQALTRREFGYDVALAIDARYVPELVRMLRDAESTAGFVGYLALAAAAVAALVAATAAAVVHLHRRAADPRFRARAGGVVALLGAIAALALGLQGPLVAVGVDQLDLALNRERRLRELGRKLTMEASIGRPPIAIGAARPSVLVFVVESYGTASFARGSPGFRAELRTADARMAAAGYAVRSATLTSPVFGGSSWMADASFQCGVTIGNQRRYAALLASKVDCLPGPFNRAGYRTVMASSNTTFMGAALEARFPYQAVFGSRDFGYRGPRYGWSRIPDQFVIDFVHRREVEWRGDRPIFAFYMLSSSHVPWSDVPPLLADWQLGDGARYGRERGQRFAGNRLLDGTSYAEGYDASVRYTLAVIWSYLERLPPDFAPLVVVFGDHQPRKPVARMKVDPWTVPIHVLGRDRALVERFASGYAAGLEPDLAAPAAPISTLVDRFAEALR